MCAFLIPAILGVGALTMMGGGDDCCETSCQPQCPPAYAAPAPAHPARQQNQYMGSYGYQQNYGSHNNYGYSQPAYSSQGSSGGAGVHAEIGGAGAGMHMNASGGSASVGMYGGR